MPATDVTFLRNEHNRTNERNLADDDNFDEWISTSFCRVAVVVIAVVITIMLRIMLALVA